MRPQRTGFALAGVLAGALVTSACASKPVPPPPPPASPAAPDEAETLTIELTKYFSLDASQQEKTRQLTRELIERNRAIRASWERGERVRPEKLLASRAQFETQFTAILTDEQKRKFQEDSQKLRMYGRSVKPSS